MSPCGSGRGGSSSCAASTRGARGRPTGSRGAGRPDHVIGGARDILKNLESAEYNEYGLPSIAGPGAAGSAETSQMELFGGRRGSADDDAVIEKIRKADVEGLSPLDALLHLAAWKERLSKGNR